MYSNVTLRDLSNMQMSLGYLVDAPVWGGHHCGPGAMRQNWHPRDVMHFPLSTRVHVVLSAGRPRYTCWLLSPKFNEWGDALKNEGNVEKDDVRLDNCIVEDIEAASNIMCVEFQSSLDLLNKLGWCAFVRSLTRSWMLQPLCSFVEKILAVGRLMAR